ncbi:MAG: metallophosphoesterase [Clostridia bacterium]|nr:metallophosphoesterase [Clostridia bacterium]
MKNDSLTVLGGIALGALAALAVSERIKIVPYVIHTNKVTSPVRLLHVSDLHSALYGRNQQDLLALTHQIAPDAILFTGDIAEERVSPYNAFLYTKAVGNEYPCFYVSGNHEYYTHRAMELKRAFSSHGLAVLEGSCATLSVGDQALTVFGIDDPYGFPDAKMRLWEDQLNDCNAAVEEDRFSILLTHRPELVRYYADTDFDLILSGHAHGGQFIIPHVLNGLYAPQQGFFPKYAGGRYQLKDAQTMIVSRGLSKYVKPRVFNRPELVVITLLPEKSQ